MPSYVEIFADVFIPRGVKYEIEFVAIKEGEYLKPGAHLGLIQNEKGGGASLHSQFGGEVVKVLVREGDDFFADTPIAILKLNPHEGVHGWKDGKVFVVHGHDRDLTNQVLEFLERIDLTPISLGEEPNKGMTIIEKFESHADVGFAVVLFSPDDLGADKESAKAGNLQPRARQNVVLELGYFIARLGRSRVCALRRGDVEVPSDILGFGYVDFDSNLLWQQQPIRELHAAGYKLDPNILPRD
jgi:hypothetical protein